MSFASIMVVVDSGTHAPARIRLASDLARRFGARLVGAAACRPDYPQGYGETIVPPGYAIENIRQAALDHLADAKRRFDDAAGTDVPLDWQADMVEPIRLLEEHARAADLIVVGSQGRGDGPAHGMALDAGDAMMRTGRPTLVVPPGIGHVEARRVVVGWKNTLQTRRAMSDALPLLVHAESVHVVAVSDVDEPDDAEDAAAFLRLHDVEALSIRRRRSGGSVAERLEEAAADFQADLIVAGGYGHGRLREWIFGGVTRTLLTSASICCLMSH